MSETPNVVVRLLYYPATGNNKQYAARRAYYTSNVADDYMRYIDKGAGAAPPPDYVGYVGDGEKSSGVFGKGGMLSKEQKAEIRDALRVTGSVVWDMVISFESKYGDKHLTDADAAQGMLKSQLNRFFKKAGLNPGNMVWFAGLHTNTDNRHLHVSFFEREPLSIRQKDKSPHYHNGKLRKTAFEDFRLAIEQHFSDTATQIKAARKELTASVNAAFSDAAYNRTVRNKLLKIAAALPPSGHLAYDSGNMDAVRPLVDQLTAYILRRHAPTAAAYSELKTFLNLRDGEIRDACRKQRIKNVGNHLVSDKIIRDLYRRLGNNAIAAARVIRSRQNDDRLAAKRNSIQRRIARNKLARAIGDCLKLGARYEEECKDAFQEYLERLEAAGQAELERGDYEM